MKLFGQWERDENRWFVAIAEIASVQVLNDVDIRIGFRSREADATVTFSSKEEANAAFDKLRAAMMEHP